MTPTAPTTTTSKPRSPQGKYTSSDTDFVVLDRPYQKKAASPKKSSVLPEEPPADLVPFRNLSRDVFAGDANREYIKEAIFFGSISCTAAWPLTVMLHQLATMIISPPVGSIW